MAMAPLALSMSLTVAQEQDQDPSLPRTPTAFETRNTGEDAGGDASIRKEEGKSRNVGAEAFERADEPRVRNELVGSLFSLKSRMSKRCA